MKILVDSNDLPAPTRLQTWRGLLCDTYMGIDCRFAGDFRSIISGHAHGEYSLTRIRSSHNSVDRSPTLIKRDGLELLFFGVLLAGGATTIQGGREVAFKRGAVIITDSSRPFQTHVDTAADITWLSVPKMAMTERVRGIEDLVALSLEPAKPIEDIVTGLMAGFDEVLTRDAPPQDIGRLTTETLDVLAMTILSAGLPPTRPARARAPIQ